MSNDNDIAGLPELPKPKRYFGHSTSLPMYSSEECLAYAVSVIQRQNELVAALENCVKALAAMRILSDAGPQPRNSDEALWWWENDRLARRLCEEAEATATALLSSIKEK